MQRNKILLTGHPGVGKTTLVRKVVEQCGLPLAGFITEEIREGGIRMGFRARILSCGKSLVLAHVDIKSKHRVGKYGVDVEAFEQNVCGEIENGIAKRAMVVIDEIGRMELFSELFREVVVSALNSESAMLGTILQRSDPFGDWVKKQKHVNLIEVTQENRDSLVDEILGQVKDKDKDS